MSLASRRIVSLHLNSQAAGSLPASDWLPYLNRPPSTKKFASEFSPMLPETLAREKRWMRVGSAARRDVKDHQPLPHPLSKRFKHRANPKQYASKSIGSTVAAAGTIRWDP